MERGRRRIVPAGGTERGAVATPCLRHSMRATACRLLASLLAHELTVGRLARWMHTAERRARGNSRCLGSRSSYRVTAIAAGHRS